MPITSSFRMKPLKILFGSSWHTITRDNSHKVSKFIFKKTYEYNHKKCCVVTGDSSDGSCEDGCNLKLAQKLAQHQLVRIVK